MPENIKENILGKTLKELKIIVGEMGLPTFTARQLAEWMYKKGVTSFEKMTNLSKDARKMLSKQYQVGYDSYTKVETSVDGTKKYLFPVRNNHFVEAAYIPETDRATLCVSSQAGCKMGCLFCMTGKQGFQTNMSSGEIIHQILALPEYERLTNIVYMGMGEPFDNIDNVLNSLEVLTSDYGFGWSPKRITVSTIGILPAMERFLNESSCHLAVSLHSPFHNERKELMPVESVYTIDTILEVLKQFDFGRQRRVSFEYIMFKGVNDSPRHAKELSKLLNGLKCRVNLIRFHPIPDTPLQGSGEETILKFRDALNSKGILATIRTSRGVDISAACGLLSTKKLVEKSETDY